MARVTRLQNRLSVAWLTLTDPDWKRRRVPTADPDLAARLANVRLVAFDLDGTLTARANSWALVTSRFPGQSRVAAREFRQWARGRITRQELCDRVVRLWQPPPSRAELGAWLADVELAPGAEALVATLHQRGVATAIISTGLHLLAERVAAQLGIEHLFANRLHFDEADRLRPRVSLQVTPRGKATILRDLAARLGVPREQTMFVGDSKEDASAVRWAGIGTFVDQPNQLLFHGDLITPGLAELDQAFTTAPLPQREPEPAGAEGSPASQRLTSSFGPSFAEEYSDYTAWKRAQIAARGWRDRKILDVGCSAGLLEAPAAAVNEVHGIDLEGDALRAAAAKGYRLHSFDLNRGAALPFADGAFDVVLAFDIVEHVPDPFGLMQELKRVLRPGGELVVSVPNSFNVINRLTTALGWSVDITDRHHQLALPFSDHLHRIALGNFRETLSDLGFRLQRTEIFVPVNVRHRELRRLEPLAWLTERLGLAERWPTLLGFAFLFLCERPPDLTNRP